MSSSGPPKLSFRRWARGLKDDVKDGYKRLIRSTTPSRPSTPGPLPAEATRGVEGPSDVNAVQVSPLADIGLGGSSFVLAPAARQPQDSAQPLSGVSPLEAGAALIDPSQPRHGITLGGPNHTTGHGALPAHQSPADESAQPPSTIKDALKVSLNFTATLLKRLPEIVDGNPVKMALSLAKMIVEIKEVGRLPILMVRLLTYTISHRP